MSGAPLSVMLGTNSAANTEYSIYEAAGKEKLLKARESIGALQEGEAAFTPAYGLNAKVVIHTVAPVWKDGKSGEKERLAACYENALAIAEAACGGEEPQKFCRINPGEEFDFTINLRRIAK